MIYSIRYKQPINNAYQWDGNEDAAKEYFKDQFQKIIDNILFICAYDQQSYVVIRKLSIGDWYIPQEGDFPYICNNEEFQQEFEIVENKTNKPLDFHMEITESRAKDFVGWSKNPEIAEAFSSKNRNKHPITE